MKDLPRLIISLDFVKLNSSLLVFREFGREEECWASAGILCGHPIGRVPCQGLGQVYKFRTPLVI
jgi:hypothetical protein